MAEATNGKEKKVPLVKKEPMDSEVTAEQLQGQLNYAQKIINVLLTIPNKILVHLIMYIKYYKYINF